MSRPVLALDVDGVLAADPHWITGGTEALNSLGYRAYEFDGLGPDGTDARGMVWLNPEHGVWLRELLDRGVEVTWATSWGQVAAGWIAPRLSLPAFSVIEVPNFGPRFGRSPKLAPITQWVGSRPLVWVNDQFGGKEPGWAEDRRDEDGVPTLIIQPNPGRGLERAHIDEVLTWLDAEVERGSRVAKQ